VTKRQPAARERERARGIKRDRERDRKRKERRVCERAGWLAFWLAGCGRAADLARLDLIGCETWLRTARTSLQLLPIVATAGVPSASSSLQVGWGVGGQAASKLVAAAS
jgi:hypothetical protein